MAERPVLEAVLFDAGGTLGRLDFEWMAAAVNDACHLATPVDAAILRVAELEGRRRYDTSLGVAALPGEPPPPLGAAGDTHAYFNGMLAAAGVAPQRAPEALAAFMARQAGVGLWTRVMEGAREALDGVRALGLRRAVVSNSDARAAQHIRDWGLFDELEFVVDSGIVGIEKPDPRIFRIALDRLQLPAQRVIYVGDIRSVDEVGSRAAGLHFVLIDPSGSYAAPGGPAIAHIAELPAWLRTHFRCPAETNDTEGVRT